jgi:hypothetical protein
VLLNIYWGSKLISIRVRSFVKDKQGIFKEQYSHPFGCGLGSYHFRYLGIPMHHKKISSKERRGVGVGTFLL